MAEKKLDLVLKKIYEIDLSILAAQSEETSLYEDEFYRFTDVISFSETFKNNEILEELYPETSFLVYEPNSDFTNASIIRQYSNNAIDAFCDYLDEFKYDYLTEEEVDEIRRDLLDIC